jgi:hypothetical protein
MKTKNLDLGRFGVDSVEPRAREHRQEPCRRLRKLKTQ